MTQETKHTPTPYYFDECNNDRVVVKGSNGDTVLHIEFIDMPAFMQSQAIQTAKFIVRACNTHDELVQELDLLCPEYCGSFRDGEEYDENDYGYEPVLTMGDIKRIRHLIKKARG